MNKLTIILLAVFGIMLVLAIVFGSTYVGYSNREIRLKNLINSKLEDNKSEYDNMWKKVRQVAQVTKSDRESLMKVFVEHAKARNTGGSKDGSLMRWIKESVPNVDSTTYKNLMNIIASSRDSWTMRQKELIDMKREHDNIRMTFPGSLFLSGRESVEITVVTSGKTKETFRTGEDNDTDVFDK